MTFQDLTETAKFHRILVVLTAWDGRRTDFSFPERFLGYYNLWGIATPLGGEDLLQSKYSPHIAVIA
jgi:nicotinamidase-related amidase